jgi:hypothetical protein
MTEYLIDDKYKAKLILKGQWLYDNILPRTVRIYELDFDFYYVLDYENLDPGEKISLNEDGLQYVITWNQEDEFSFHSDPTEGGLTLEEAIDTAERITQQKIKWDS